MQIRTGNILMAGILLSLALPALAQKPAPPNNAGHPIAPGGPRRGGPPGQGPGGGRGMRGGRGASLAMLPVSVLDAITPLKADQKAKITAIQDKARADMKTADRGGRGPIFEKATADVKAVLTPAQTASVEKSFPTLMLIGQSRAIPLGALGDVKLTKAQMTKIMGFTAPVAAQMKGLQGPDRMAKMQQAGPALKTQIDGVLTKSQKDIIAKYEAAHPPRPGGFGGPGGGPGRGPGGFGGPGRGPGGAPGKKG
jgi:hypothetical protein